jgi:hypothetical protein
VPVARRARRGVTLALLPARLGLRLDIGWLGVGLAAAVVSLAGCTTVDPGPNYVVPDETFDADFYYCHVEPQLITALKCGPGDPAKMDLPNSCHFSSAVSGMELLDHPAIDCGGGDHPLDPTQIGTGSPAQSDLEAVSIEMGRDYTHAPLFVRPSGSGHPRMIFSQTDPAINQLLAEWASK